MASDAHAHPYDLMNLEVDAEQERCALGIACAASAWNMDEFLFQEKLSKSLSETEPPMALCFGVHPQLAAGEGKEGTRHSLDTLYTLVAEKRLRAIGEAGFDLYDHRFKSTEALQEELFCAQLELALHHGLPLVLHLRKAMHKAFKYSKELKALPVVIFHSYSGTYREAEDFLKRGVNAYFSFGTTIALNHKIAQEAVSKLPAEHLLFETDAPYQGLRGKDHSSWKDVFVVLKEASRLRLEARGQDKSENRQDLEKISDLNFSRCFGYTT